MALPSIYIDLQETFFHNKNSARSYFVDYVKKTDSGGGINATDLSQDQAYYLYEMKVTIDIDKIGSGHVENKIDHIAVLLSDSATPTEQVSNLSLNGLTSNSETAISAIMQSENYDLLFDILENLNSDKMAITTLDPKQFIDMQRFKNNYRGAPADKYGLVRAIQTYSEPHPKPNTATSENEGK